MSGLARNEMKFFLRELVAHGDVSINLPRLVAVATFSYLVSTYTAI